MPRQICTGCGLTTDANGNLIVNTGAIEWPYSSCGPEFGSPLYCGDDGILRGPPQPIASLITLETSFDYGTGTALTEELVEYGTLSFEAVNPSSCLPAIVYYTAEVEASADLDPGARFRTYINDNRYQDWTNSGADPVTNVGWQLSRSVVFVLAAGASSTQTVTVKNDRIGSDPAEIRRVEIRIRGTIVAMEQ